MRLGVAERSQRGPGGRRDLSGTVLDGRYRIIAPLGLGGMGTVYEGVQVTLDKPVAVKVLKAELADDAAYVERFFREAKAASRVGHRNVVHIMDFGRVPAGPVYYVMELLRGIDLSQLIKEQGRLAWRRTRHIILQVLAALEAAHREGVIHRDIKPANIYLLRDRGDDEDTADFVKVLDFGIAKILDSSDLTRADEIVGTASYMAPEQAHGVVDERSDAYSVGVLMYKMLTGMTPFRGANGFEILRKHQSDPPPPLRTFAPDLSVAVEALVLQALAKRPELRFQSMAEMRAAVRAIPASASGRRRIAGTELPTGPGTPTQVRAVARAQGSPGDISPVETERGEAARGETQIAHAPVPFIETERVPEMPPPAAPLDGGTWMPEPTGPSGPATFSSVFSDTATTTHGLRARGRLLKGVTVGLALAAAVAATIVVVSLGSDDPPPASPPKMAPAVAPPSTPTDDPHPPVVITPPQPEPRPEGVVTLEPSAGPDAADDAADDAVTGAEPERETDAAPQADDAAIDDPREPVVPEPAVDPPRPDTGAKPRPVATDDTVKRKLVRRAKGKCAGLGAGRVEVTFSIQSSGDVMLVDARAPHAEDELGRCVEGVVKGARFPKGQLRRESISVRW
jgi:serine/threonine protein kinase